MDDYFAKTPQISLTLKDDISMKPHFNGNTKLVFADENFKVDDTNSDLHVLVSKNAEFGKVDEKEKTRNWFWIEPQAVPIQVSKVDGDKKSYFVKIRISNPKDISLELIKGDKVGLGRIELRENPDKPDFLPYSSLPNTGKRKRKNKKQRKAAAKKKVEEEDKQKKREAERKEISSKLSFDLDALDFEPVNSDEEKEGNDKNDEVIAVEDDDNLSEVSMSDAESNKDDLDEISEEENIEAMETDADRQQKQLEKNLEPVSESEEMNNEVDDDSDCVVILSDDDDDVIPPSSKSSNKEKTKPVPDSSSKKKGSEPDIPLPKEKQIISDPLDKADAVSDVDMDEIFELNTSQTSMDFEESDALPPGMKEVDLRAARFDPKYATPRTPTTSENGEPAPPGESDPAPPGEEPVHNNIPSAKSNGVQASSENGTDKSVDKPAAKKKQAAARPQSAVKQTADKDKLKAQTVKVLKSLLVKHELSTSGLKADLIKRLLEFYTENPTQVDDEVALKEKDNKDHGKEASKNTTEEPIPTVITTSATNQSSENEELENFDLSTRSAPHLFEADQPAPPGESPVKRSAAKPAAEPEDANFEPGKGYPHLFRPERPVNAQVIEEISTNVTQTSQHALRPNLSVIMPVSTTNNSPMLQSSYSWMNNGNTANHSLLNQAHLPPPPPPITPSSDQDHRRTAIKTEIDSKVSQKQAEIKALATIETAFHDRVHFVELKEALTFEQVGYNVVNFHLAPLDIFISDLPDRKVRIKKQDRTDFQIPKQICKIKLQGRNVHTEILISSNKKKIEPLEGFLRLQIEKIDIDSNDPFFIPHGHVIHKGAEEMFDSEGSAAATVPADILLAPKSFHKQLCNVTLKDKELSDLRPNQLVIVNRTKDHGMNIGMRKMILIPRAVSQLQIDGDTAKIEVTIYNASRQGLRISTKTNIAKLLLCKEPEFDFETKGLVIDKVTVEPYQVRTIPTKLDERVQKGTAVLKLQEKMENGLILLPGLLAVRSREGRMYVDVPVHNDSNTMKSVDMGTWLGAFRGIKE
eukprot:TRINITY_DN10308_c0_g1_i2.p1 TRINITY_DN10308_c0_g1~~TRINITY_DN10308_c0_g1_i2.p1  ORF type:complete len:1213 (-),score=414.01 TRINITY_DN10308_c0_g1_i2:230-3334(-)